MQMEMTGEIKKILKSKGCPEDNVAPPARDIMSLAWIKSKYA